MLRAGGLHGRHELARARGDEAVLAAGERGDVDQLADPTPSAQAPAAMNSPAVWAFTPPVGSIFTSGSGPFSAFRYFGPPTAEAGKIFTMSAPAFQAVITSVGVSAPGMIGTPRSCAAAMVPRSRPGLTMNAAPASMHRRAASASSTVPAPTTRAARPAARRARG